MAKKLLCILLLISAFLCSCDIKDSFKNEESSSSTTEESEISIEDLSETSAEDILSSLTIEEKIGQMLMLSLRSYEGGNIDTTISPDLKKIIRDHNVGNIILFAENFSSIENTVKLTHSLQNALALDIPMFIGVDQEGGNVVRLSHGCSMPGNMALGAINSESDSYKAGEITGIQLAALGVNTNLAPTLDVNNNPKNPVINIRSFSENPDIVAKMGVSMINGMQSANVSACAKHFPGHGDTSIDSHYGLPSLDKSYEDIKNLELIPFQKAIDNGIDMIMTAHIQFPQIEKTEVNGFVLPSTLSKTFLTDILKNDMGFEGVVITDSMQMDAIFKNFSMEEACVLAINAGADILLMPVYLSDSKADTKLNSLIDHIKNAVISGEIPESRIDDAVSRIMKTKKARNLWETNRKSLEEKIAFALKTVGNEEHKAIERALASKAVTILENKKGTLFSDLKENSNILFIVPSESIKSTVDFALKRLIGEDALDIKYNIELTKNLNDKGFNAYDSVVIFADTSSDWKVKNTIDIYENALKSKKRIAVISCRLPYDTALFTEAECLLACYCPKGGAPSESTSAFGVNIGASLEVLFGISKGEGKLPVTVYSVDKKGNYDLNEVIYQIGYSKE